MDASIKFIGTIHSALKSIEECPLQESENAPAATITILPEFLEGIKDIKVGCKIVLLTWLHIADRKVIKCKPRNNQEAPVFGVFSTRSPDRPNPIGIHTVEVVSIENEMITVAGLEVLDLTPVIDIKPIWNR